MIRNFNFQITKQITFTRSYWIKKRVRSGMDNQIKSLETVDEITADPEGFGDIESDFMSVDKSHKDHLDESRQFKKKVELWRTKQKYFNTKNPNFLTYIEKEQIKLLHTRDPEEWNPEKLSESFPATPETIAKICKAKWIAASEDRIKKHDERVLRNWNLLKSGNLPIFDRDLKEHLERFSNRSLKDLKNVPLDGVRKPIELSRPVGNEFSSIITSCEKYQEDPKLLESQRKERTSVSGTSPLNGKGEDETFLLDKVVSKENLRFQDLKSLIKPVKSLPLQNDLVNSTTEPSKSLEPINLPQNPSGTGVVKENLFALEKFEKSEITISKEDADKFQISPIKEKVYIPRKLYKKGSTYRVEDCYYDSDGEFLYRVPGMTG
ncbi:hypothetical protein ACFFRR_000812 [Megaselia abdita]